jgi:hypothetical protein
VWTCAAGLVFNELIDLPKEGYCPESAFEVPLLNLEILSNLEISYEWRFVAPAVSFSANQISSRRSNAMSSRWHSWAVTMIWLGLSIHVRRKYSRNV